MKKTISLLLAMFLAATLHPALAEENWTAGFASRELAYDAMDAYCIAGYRNGVSPAMVRDAQRISALWLEAGDTALLLLTVDCVGLDGGMVGSIREALSDFCADTGCDSVNVVSTHTHAGVDTLGLWGPVGLDGKNEDFQQQIIRLALEAARAAHAERTAGSLLYSATPAAGLQHDSREPIVYDSRLYQLRFVPEDPSRRGLRVVNFAAHAEALRGSNRRISRDYPGVMADLIRDATGDETLYLPGAVGGLIMTKEFSIASAEKNLLLTGEKLAAHALAPAEEKTLPARLDVSRVTFATPLENTLFIWYKFLGILDSRVTRQPLGGYALHTEVSVLRAGDVALALLPGEIFPELVTGTGRPGDPTALRDIAAAYGVAELLIVGLANDEIGYIVPPSDFRLDGSLPYVQEAEGHYEETNSVGPGAARDLAIAFEKALQQLP